MSGALVFDVDKVLAFMRQRLPGIARVEGARAIGWERDGTLVAGAYYEGFNAHNMWVHLAGDGDGQWMDRRFLRAGFVYPFLVCGVKRLSGYVDESNTDALRFNEHVGFKRETTLKGAACDGGDVVLMVMWRDECRWLGV